MVNQETYTFKSSDGHSKIHCRKWIPEKKPVAVLQIIHGMVEYIERYDEFANFMAEKGFLVVGHDHIGHGHSVKKDSELGVMTGEHPSDFMVEDIFLHYLLVKENNKDIPYFIMGHSMGSYMLRKFLSVKADSIEGIKGAIIMGTGFEAPATCNAGLATIKTISLVKGKDYRSSFVRDMTYSAPYKKYDCYGKDYANSWLSKNTESVEKYYHDKYCTYMFTLNAYKGLVEATKFDSIPANIEKMRKDMPLLVVSGADDPVGNCGKGTTMAADAFKAAGVADVTLKLFEGDRHEILNELDRAQVMDYIFDWVQSKMK